MGLPQRRDRFMADNSIYRKYGGNVPDHLNVDEFPLPRDKSLQLEMAVVADYEGQKGGTQDPFEVRDGQRYAFGMSASDVIDLADRLRRNRKASHIWFRLQGIAGQHTQIVVEYMRSSD